MSLTAGHHVRKIIENVEAVTAIELLCSYQAQCFRRAILPSPEGEIRDYQLAPNAERSFGPAAESIFTVMQENGIEPVATDRPLSEDVNKVRQLIRRGAFLTHLGKRYSFQPYHTFF